MWTYNLGLNNELATNIDLNTPYESPYDRTSSTTASNDKVKMKLILFLTIFLLLKYLAFFDVIRGGLSPLRWYSNAMIKYG